MKNIKRIFAAVIMLIMLFTIVPLSPANNTAFAEETAPAGEKDAYDLSDGFKEKVYCTATLKDGFAEDVVLIAINRFESEISKRFSVQ